MQRVATMLAIVSLSWMAAPTAADELELKPGHPQRYTVKKGDTLWGIASQYLRDPWRWPEIWQRNDTIANPHLIYPGDVLVVSVVDGQPGLKVLRKRTVAKLSPSIYAEPLGDAIPTIPPGAIQPFLSAPLIIDDGDLDDAGYVAGGLEGSIVMGKYSVFWARGMPDVDNEFYQVFRPGRRLIHPETDEFLGVHAQHLGDARMLQPGETAKMEATRADEEIVPGDRMLPVEQEIGLPYYQPRAPEANLRGLVLEAPKGINEVGPYTVVVISLGQRDGLEPGHVLRIMRQEPDQVDPVTGRKFRPPLQATGLLMPFRVFEKVSYALVLRSSRPVHLLDVVQTP